MIDDIYKPFDNQNSNPVEITANNISFRYGKKVIIDRLSFKTKENKISFLMGPNGAGKTLCLKILSGILKPDKGKIIFNKRVRIGYVPQKVIFLRRSIYENLAFTMKIFKFQKNEIKKRISNIIKLTDFENKLSMSARKLSIGKQQLLAIIRSLVIKPNLLLLDEPCSNLDPHYTYIIEAIIKKASRQGVKILFVTHDLLQTKRLADEIIFLNKGRVADHSEKEIFFKNPKSKSVRNYISGKLLK